MRWGIIVFILLLAAPVYAAEGTIYILAVSDELRGQQGDIATLHLETRPGKGHVFLETFPLSKVDTQISMRFAEQVACNHLPIDCNSYDFIYTLRANSAAIGGPSAGAAAAVLTYAVLSDLPIAKDVSITGTINSGGLIGGVGGIKQKIEAAGANNLKTVLIPFGKREYKEGNITTDLVEYGKSKGVKVIEVKTIDEAITSFTGKTFEAKEVNLTLSPSYQKAMLNISSDLCNRAHKLEQAYLSEAPVEENLTLLDFDTQAKDSLLKANQAFAQGDYYSSASFCFRAAINYDFLSQYYKNVSDQDADLQAWRIKNGAQKFGDALRQKKIRTMTDLQTFMIVDERVQEAIDTADELLKSNNSIGKRYALATATERLESAVVWSRFFNLGGAVYSMDNESLRASCEDKIREAEERYQYVQMYIPNSIEGIKQQIERAGDALYAGSYELCLSKASKAKAEADVVVSLIGSDKEQLKDIVQNKLHMAKLSIFDAEEKGVFPILGFSYYQFANSLIDSDVQSAMLFAEYSLELSNLDMYFQREAVPEMTGASISDFFGSPSWVYVPWVCGGLILGVLFVALRRQN